MITTDDKHFQTAFGKLYKEIIKQLNHFAIVDCLVPAVDDSALDEPQKPVSEHLGMESEVRQLLFCQAGFA